MADSPSTPAAEPPGRGSRLRYLVRSTMPYVLGAAFAAIVLGWYFFAFVPDKLEYFVGLRFRTLAVAGGQIKSKVENLARSLDGACKVEAGRACAGPADASLAGYLAVLVSEIRLGAPSGPALMLTHDRGTVGHVSWEDIVGPIVTMSVADFDELILADDTGQVVWQRERSTPRLGNLAALRPWAAENTGFISTSWQVPTTPPAEEEAPALPDGPSLTRVNLAGQPGYLLVQPIPLTKKIGETSLTAPRLFVAGFVSRSGLQEQAMRIPVVWIAMLALPVVLLFLALPFIKLATLTPKERYGFADVILLALATIIAAGIGADLPFGTHSVDAGSDPQLERLAVTIEERLAADTRDVLELAAAIEKNEPAIAAGLRQRGRACRPPVVGGFAGKTGCNLWEALAAVPAITPAALELDVVVWIESAGEQLQKWTTKSAVTAQVSHRPYAHLRDVTLDRLWQLKNNSRRFTIEPLRTPTTADMGFVFATPTTQSQAGARRFLVLNVRPESIVDPVLPPGYGFAVLDRNGRVMFHANEALSLQEDFLAEVPDPDVLRTRLASGHLSYWSGEYRGRQHRLHLRPLDVHFTGSPWRLVTFREMEPVFDGALVRQSGIARLGILNLATLSLFLLACWTYGRLRHRRLRDVLWLSDSIRSAGRGWLLALIAGALVGLALASRAGAHDRLDWVYLYFAVLPVVTAAFVMGFKQHRSADDAATAGRAYVFDSILLVLLVSVLPAVGFSRIVDQVYDLAQVEASLETSARRWDARHARVLERVQGPGYGDATRARILASGFAMDWRASAAAGPEPRFSYLSSAGGVRLDEPPLGTADVRTPAGQAWLKWILGWTWRAGWDAPGASAVVRSHGADVLRLPSDSSRPSFTAGLAVVQADHRASPARILLGLTTLVGAIAGFCWARRRLILAPWVPATTLLDHLRTLGTGNEAVLLIGPPRMQKDRAVAAASRQCFGPDVPITRVPLLDATIDDAFIAASVARVNDAGKARLALADPGRLPIHVSNLETQLVTADARRLVLTLLEKLLEHSDECPPKVLIVTTSVDPIANFEEVFQTEREGIHTNALPEVALSRSALLLSRFRRCYLPIPAGRSDDRWHRWLQYSPSTWLETVRMELDPYDPLKPIVKDFEAAPPDQRPSVEQLELVVTARAEAAYELLWTSCTRSEKLVLIQLAQEGLINPKSRNVAARLIAKGLITDTTRPAIFNFTFRSFLRRIERDAVIDQWERMEGSGLWVTAGRMVGSIMITAGLFFLMTQDFSVQALLPLVSGTGLFGIPIVRDLLARLSGRPGADA